MRLQVTVCLVVLVGGCSSVRTSEGSPTPELQVVRSASSRPPVELPEPRQRGTEGWRVKGAPHGNDIEGFTTRPSGPPGTGIAVKVSTAARSYRVLAYRLYTICEKPRPALAGPYNALAASWTEMQRLGQAAPVAPRAAPEQQSFDVGQS